MTKSNTKQKKSKNAASIAIFAIGTLASMGVGGFCVMTVNTAFARMNDQSEKAIADALALASRNGAAAGNTEASENTQSTQQWTSEQIQWMTENHITYDKFGLPINENGEVVNDPTTANDERQRAKYFYNDDGSEKDFEAMLKAMASEDTNKSESTAKPMSTPKTEATAEPAKEASNVETQAAASDTAVSEAKWYLNADGSLKDGIELDENGKPYHVVTPYDCLSSIGDKYGFDYHELARINGIENVNLIIDDSRIYFE